MRHILGTNLKCQVCLNKLAPVLDADNGVENWSADLEHPEKLVTIDSGSLSSQEIVDLIASAGFHARTMLTASEVPGASSIKAASGADVNVVKIQAPVELKPNWLATYKPLLIVVAYCTGGAVVLASARGVWTAGEVMSNFMGCFFLGFAFFKLLDIPKFADSFSSYDPIASRIQAYGLVYPFVELILGLMFVLQVGTLIANIATIIVLGVGLVGVAEAVTRKRTIQCACLGTVFNLPMTSVTIIENTVMVAMALVALLQ